MSNAALAKLRARKNQGTAAKAPVKAPAKIGKATATAAATEDDDLDDDEVVEEVVAKPATKKPVGKAKAKPAPEPVEEDDEDLDDEEVDEDEDVVDEDGEGEDPEEEVEEEEEVAPAPKVTKKPVAKGKAKAPVKPVPETAEEDDEDLDDEEVDEEVDEEEAPAPKVTKKPVAKGKVAAKPVATATAKAPAKSGGLFGSSSRPEPKERRVFTEGDHITREEVIRRFAESRGISQADAARGFQDIENFMLEEIFPLFSVNFFNVKFRRTVTEATYRESAGGLDVVTDGLTTEISAHTAIRASIYLGKEKRKGKIVKGEFVPGHMDAKGKFVRDVE